MNLESAKLLAAGAATIALSGAAIGIGNVFSSLILAFARNPKCQKQLFSYAMLGFALKEAIALFALLAELLQYLFYRVINFSIERSFSSIPFIRGFPLWGQALFVNIFKYICISLLYRGAISVGYLWMDELSRAVLPFLSNAGGEAGGAPNPGLPPESSNTIPMIVEPQEDSFNEPGWGAEEISKAQAELKDALEGGYHPEYAASLVSQERIIIRMIILLRRHQIVKDPGDVRRGVEMYCWDYVSSGFSDPQRMEQMFQNISQLENRSPHWKKILHKIFEFTT